MLPLLNTIYSIKNKLTYESNQNVSDIFGGVL
jgi:hypothetical protein